MAFPSPLFPELIRFWAQTISFRFSLSIAIQYGGVELLPKIPDQRNRLRHKIARTMTYSSSLYSCSTVKFRLRFEFHALELSNDVFNFIVRRRSNRLWYMANQTDGTLHYLNHFEPATPYQSDDCGLSYRSSTYQHHPEASGIGFESLRKLRWQTLYFSRFSTQ